MSMTTSQDHAPAIGSVTSGQSHTPGPWREDHRNGSKVIRGEDSGCVAVIPALETDGHGYVSLEERGANARLIAAAPEMLEALKDLRLVLRLAAFKFGFDLTDSAAMEQADTIIAKVEGSK